MNISLSRCVVGYNPKIPNGSPWGKVQAENEKPETVHQGWARCANVINLTYFQDSHIVRLVCDETEQDEELMKELEKGEDVSRIFIFSLSERLRVDIRGPTLNRRTKPVNGASNHRRRCRCRRVDAR